MAIIDLPTKFAFTSVRKFGLTRAGNALRSKYTGQAQRIVYPFAVWEFEGDLVEYDGLEAGAIRSFLIQLEGQRNSFRLPVPGYDRPSTGWLPPVTGLFAFDAPARASALQMMFNHGGVPIFNEGDFFTINDELKMVTAPVASHPQTGQALVNFKPALRKPVLTGNAPIVVKPTVLMHAADDDVASWGLAPPVRQSSSFSAVEAVEI